jgi:hypothetical protein
MWEAMRGLRMTSMMVNLDFLLDWVERRLGD